MVMAGNVKPREPSRPSVRTLIREPESLDLSEPQNRARADMIVLELFGAAIVGDRRALGWVLQHCVDEEGE
jgi:hypothetical protein